MVGCMPWIAVALAIAIEIVSGTEVSNRYNLSQNSNTETIKIGNTKTKNYNVQESNYLPTQLTQVVLNVPKLNKKLRKSRPPTVEEFAIKRKIVDIYDEAKLGSRVHMNHLGSIIQSLNPKYIATERVRRVVFADPRDPIKVESPYHEFEGPLELSLESSDLTIGGQLDVLNQRFRNLVNWNQGFLEELANTSDEVLNSEQSAFKRLILCLSHPTLCNLLSNKEHSSFSETERQPDELQSSASETNNIYEVPDPEFSSQQVASDVRSDDEPPRGYHRSNSDQTNKPLGYKPAGTSPMRNFGGPSYGVNHPEPMYPAYNHGNQGRVVQQKNRFPRFRNFRFTDQQPKPRILTPRHYPMY